MLLTVADLFARCQLYTCQQELPHMYVNTMFTYDHCLPHTQQSTNSWCSNNVLKLSKQAVSSHRCCFHNCLLVQSTTVSSSTVNHATVLPASLQQYAIETHQRLSLAAS